MEYPGTIITRPYRRLIFYLTALVFFVASPLIILYTIGYRYDFKMGVVKETGAISIDIEPLNAKVYVNGKLAGERMPIRLKNVIPGKYKIKIDAGENYYPWEKETEVKKMETLYIKEIRLLQKNSPSFLKTGAIENLALSGDKKTLAYTIASKTKEEIWVYDIASNQHSLITEIPKNNDTKILWSPKSDYFSVSNQAGQYLNLIIVDNNKKTVNADLAKDNENKIEKFEWRNSGEAEIYFQANKKIFSYRPTVNNTILIVKNTFLDWKFEDNKLWTLSTDTTTGNLIITSDQLGFSSLFSTLTQKKYTNFKFEQAKNGTVILKNPQADEMVLVNKNISVELSGRESKISPYNEWWLIWTPWELTTYIENDEPILLNRSGEQLNNVIPMDKYNTLGLIWADKMTIIFPYYFVGHDFIKAKITNAKADDQNRTIYFVANMENQNGLWKLNY